MKGSFLLPIPYLTLQIPQTSLEMANMAFNFTSEMLTLLYIHKCFVSTQRCEVPVHIQDS